MRQRSVACVKRLSGKAKTVQKRAKPRHMAADLHDGNGLHRADRRLKVGIVKRTGKNGQPVASRHEGPDLGGGTCRQAGDPGHDLHIKPVSKTDKKIHEGAIEQRIALTQHHHVTTGFQMQGDVGRAAVVDCLRRSAPRAHRHHHRDLDGVRTDRLGHNRTREGGAGIRRRIGDDLGFSISDQARRVTSSGSQGRYQRRKAVPVSFALPRFPPAPLGHRHQGPPSRGSRRRGRHAGLKDA